MRPWNWLVAVLLLAYSSRLVHAARDPPGEDLSARACLECHGDPKGDGFIDLLRFEHSAHGAFECTDCHQDITVLAHDTPLKPVNCGACHRIETEIYSQSDHGRALQKGVSQAASCADCHGDSHQILDSRQSNSPVNRVNIPDTCTRCHGQAEEMTKFHLAQLAPVMTYNQSVHGIALKEKNNPSTAVCTDCHGSHDLQNETNPQSKLYWRNLPNTCGKCHQNIQETYELSVHGQAVKRGKREAPVCTDCHGEHSIEAVKLATSKGFPSHIAETCGQCHGVERIITKYRLPAHVVDTFMDSYHGLALQLGSLTAANCASCHGTHNILPSSDPRSTTHKDNLQLTCGRCHPGVSEQVAKGQIHSGTQPGVEHFAVSLVRQFYVFLFIFVLGGMLVHNALDLIKKIRSHLREMKTANLAYRMTLNQRIQHGFLILMFAVLAYTGFALKFPDSWWASPFASQVDWRGYGHRVAALLFCVLSVYHLGFMFFTKKGRWELGQLAFRRLDVSQFIQMLGYYVGARREKPRFGRYGYVEKVEYWALVWGSIIMVVTGGLMTWNEWTLSLFPKWVFDVVTAIHYYEAILACMAVIIWHFYFVIFDPDEYPIKWTFLSGRESEADRERIPPDQLEPPRRSDGGGDMS